MNLGPQWVIPCQPRINDLSGPRRVSGNGSNILQSFAMLSVLVLDRPQAFSTTLHLRQCHAVRENRELQLERLTQYRRLLANSEQEWQQLDALCRISVSRFYRNQGVFRRLEQELLPRLEEQALIRGEQSLRIWSAGCASGEEA